MSRDDLRKARRQLAREQGTVFKDWGGRIPVALVYPNSYYVGMSNLGIHAIYHLLNGYSEIVCERAFCEVDNSGAPALSLESQRPLSDFAIVAFSISYELDYFNVVKVLKASGIPLYATDRDERHPIVIAGGPCVIANPAPVSPFFDCLCIGEAEAILPDMLTILREGITGKRDELLKALAALPGVYVPLMNSETPVIRQCARQLDDFPVTSTILTPDTELGGLFLIEVERGCNWGCRFCLASQAFRPARFRSIDRLIAQAELGLKQTKRLGLVGAAVPDHPQIEELVTRLHRQGSGLSISSLRIRPLSRVVLRELVRSGARTIALAPEAGSQRLRDIIKKGITENDILEAMDKIAEQKLRQLKLYFMIGLPSETDDDIGEIIRLVLTGKGLLDRRRSGCRISLNIAPFVPKAGTPFQWLPMASLTVLNHRLSRLKSSLLPDGIKLKWESPAWSEIQAVLARGDTKLAEVLANTDKTSLSGWRQAAAKCQLDTEYYAHQRWETSQKLPWATINPDSSARLELELQRAFPRTE